ncbi:hypothetical protein [Tumidithrix helvetica]|uniref:hypothetical protein n=1 Tax=Tumidithrix helvetica TaxID=3457545 RepID=UPI003CC590A9
MIQYLPELKDRGLDASIVRDLLRMSSGVLFEENGTMFLLAVPFSDDPLSYTRGRCKTLQSP